MADSKKIAELEKKLREAEIRAEQERQRAEQEKHRREQERQRAEREKQNAEREKHRREQEQQRREKAEEMTQPTTLNEYIAACHDLVFSKFRVEQDKTLTSTGPVANPHNKLCPTFLKPWNEFLLGQRTTFGLLYASFPTERRVFENRTFLHGLGNRVSQRPIADEKGLEYFLHNSVEDPVNAIVNELKKVSDLRNEFDIGGGVVFENHPHALSDISKEVLEQEPEPMSPRTPDHRRDLNQLRPDQICVYRSDDGPSATRSIIYVCEYKAPHKLTAQHLRVGLRSMDVFRDVVNRETIPTSADPDKLFRYHAERITAAALTQTYHYMIHAGIEYGLLTTGEAIVFLKVNWEEPETLLYHLAEPESEVASHPHHVQSCAAVGQYLAFGLSALGLPGQRREYGQEERRRVISRLRTWAQDFESMLRTIPASERKAPDSCTDSPDYQPTTHSKVDRSPVFLRNRVHRVGDNKPVYKMPRRDSLSSSDDECTPKAPHTPSPAPRSEPSGKQLARRNQHTLAQPPRGPREGEAQSRRYCTQGCLLGLVKGDVVDPQCPNVALHRNSSCVSPNDTQARHPVRHDEWLRLLSQQLAHSLDQGIIKLGQEGARGVLFQVTMLAYGYTFVCKGTVQAFVKDLEHEAAVYKRLEAVQGISVPVFLGAVDLRSINRTYYYDHRVYIIHMTFFSWGGCSLDKVAISISGKERLKAKALQALGAIHREGVLHEDVRTANILLNPETQEVMVIDFERAILLDPPRRPLGQLVPNKRTWSQSMTEEKNGAHYTGKSKPEQRFSNDRVMISMAFERQPGALLI